MIDELKDLVVICDSILNRPYTLEIDDIKLIRTELIKVINKAGGNEKEGSLHDLEARQEILESQIDSMFKKIEQMDKSLVILVRGWDAMVKNKAPEYVDERDVLEKKQDFKGVQFKSTPPNTPDQVDHWWEEEKRRKRQAEKNIQNTNPSPISPTWFNNPIWYS